VPCILPTRERFTGIRILFVSALLAWGGAGPPDRVAAGEVPDPGSAYRQAVADLESARARADSAGERAALESASRAANRLGRYADVIRHGTDLLRLQTAQAPAAKRADTLATVGNAWYMLSDHEKALDHLIRALALAEAARDKRLMARITTGIGFVHRDQKNHEKAIELFTRSAAVSEEIGDLSFLAASLNELGNVRSTLGQHDEALALKQRALEVARNGRFEQMEAFCLNDIGEVLSRMGRHQDALSRFEQAEELLSGAGREREVSFIHMNQASEMTHLGRVEEAAGLARRVIGHARAGGFVDLLEGALGVLARAEAASGRPAEAYVALQEAHELRGRLFDERGAKRIAEQQIRFDFERKERQIRELENTNAIHALRHSRERILRYATVAGLALLGILAFLVHNRYRLSVRARRALQAAHDEIQVKNGELEEANGRLAEAALTDALTGLLNRRGLQDRIELERVRSLRSGRPFSILLGDIDLFKSINDRWGHQAGDLVLAGVARVMGNAVRRQDATARWGGEEFMLLLPETDEAGAAIVAEKVRVLIQEHGFSFDGERIPVTMTFGVCGWDPSLAIEECTRLADEALYAGKSAGRNRVVTAPARRNPATR
jgi:diguanylate cyclase (GGDEF)-like protein